MSQVVQQEALTRLLVEKGIFTKKELLEMVKVVEREKAQQNGHPRLSMPSQPSLERSIL